ncbi:SbmA/BacA-like family transporter, partial [Escherichia coli]
AEINRLGGLFGAIISNYLGIVYRRIKLGSFTLSYSQISVVFPYILAAPSYFLKKITLGQFQQTADAFSSVQSSLSF